MDPLLRKDVLDRHEIFPSLNLILKELFLHETYLSRKKFKKRDWIVYQYEYKWKYFINRDLGRGPSGGRAEGDGEKILYPFAIQQPFGQEPRDPLAIGIWLPLQEKLRHFQVQQVGRFHGQGVVVKDRHVGDLSHL